ncbi:unnamed protein product [Protopolystoma xenopodis]|uniref:Rubicon Homology domain-containing protein n=1 Tax=Protopolystoma xenopodis TaxID=117903 RepID=A0A3S5BR19_9PLAT|nr:unnamed protein product [Protopolystoma xenopodis]
MADASSAPLLSALRHQIPVHWPHPPWLLTKYMCWSLADLCALSGLGFNTSSMASRTGIVLRSSNRQPGTASKEELGSNPIKKPIGSGVTGVNEFSARLRSALEPCLSHVASCTRCLARGDICELCRSSRLLYPFTTPPSYITTGFTAGSSPTATANGTSVLRTGGGHLNFSRGFSGVVICPVCGACYHGECVAAKMQTGNQAFWCPRCQRRKKRQLCRLQQMEEENESEQDGAENDKRDQELEMNLGTTKVGEDFEVPFEEMMSTYEKSFASLSKAESDCLMLNDQFNSR